MSLTASNSCCHFSALIPLFGAAPITQRLTPALSRLLNLPFKVYSGFFAPLLLQTNTTL